MIKSKYKIKRFFTLIEMIVTLSVFLILIAIVLTFYDTVFKATESSRNSSDVFSNARVALDVITRDIQCIFYKNEIVPFWHKGETGVGTGEYDNDLIAFISATPLPQSDGLSSKLCEVKYQLSNTLINEGWILRSVTGDDSDSWNFQDNFDVIETSPDGNDYAFSADNSSNEEYEAFIPYVRALSFECYDNTGNEIPATGYTKTQFPYSIRVSLTLVDENAWIKYENLRVGDPGRAEAVLDESERTFTKTIFVGDHGQ
jgi:type II secretory pathway pseudopilin PulG